MYIPWEIQRGLLDLGFKSNYLDLTTHYNFILILEDVDTAKVGGKLDYRHMETNHKDDSN